MAKTKYTIFLQLVLLLSIGCRKECEPKPCNDPSNPSCENYDPCYGKSPVTAEFDFGLSVNGFPLKDYDLPYIGDSVFSQAGDLKELTLYFKAKEHAAKYKWLLGSEIITDSVFVRNFRGVPEGKYTVTLIIEKEPDVKCFPNDDGKDTLTKSFWIKPVYETAIVGKFKVLFDGATDSSIIQIKPWKSKDNIKWPVWDTMSKTEISFINFDNSHDTLLSYLIPSVSAWTGSNIYFIKDETPNNNATWYTCSNGYINIVNNKQIFGTYTYLRKKRTFNGRKL